MASKTDHDISRPWEEIQSRLKMRDSALAIYAAAFTAILGYSLDSEGNLSLLLGVPFVALVLATLAAYHDFVMYYLIQYCVNQKDGWVTSSQRKNYSRSTGRHLYLLVQILTFTGSSVISLYASRTFIFVNPQIEWIWYLGLVLTILTFIVCVGMRTWRFLYEKKHMYRR